MSLSVVPRSQTHSSVADPGFSYVCLITSSPRGLQVTLEKDGTLPTLAVEHCPAPLPPHPNSVGDDLRATHVTQTLSHLKHSFLSIHTMPVAAGSLAYVEHYRPRVYESKSICCLNPSQRPLFLVTNEALTPPPTTKRSNREKLFG